jgi:hypothetical protein
MGFSGDPKSWLPLFPDDLVPKIIDLFVASWETFPKPASTDLEVPINARFCAHLRSQRDARNLSFNIGSESDELDPVTGELLGRIDLRLTASGCRETVYFAVECKRLNIEKNGKRSSLAGDYVEKGMLRFVTGKKYASGLDKGGMLGYVMDGKLDDAMASVKTAIEAQRGKLNMDTTATLLPSSLRPKKKQVNETQHLQKGKPFTIYHVFVPVV